MKAYKGFNKDMKCRGFQYEEGKTYEMESAELCDHGFHACEYPLDCFGYYFPADSVYHEVKLDGVTDEKRDDTKRVGTKITVKGALNIRGLIGATFEYVKSRCTNSKNGDDYSALAGGNYSALTGGYRSALTGGDYSALAGGDMSALTGGNYSVIYGGIGSKVRGGLHSVLAIRYCDEHQKMRIAFAEVDGEKIKADTWYKLDDNYEFVEVE